MLKRLLPLLLAFVVCASAQTTVFFEDFSGSGSTDLDGTAPDIRPGGETWTVQGDFWKADGSIAGVEQSASAFLPFSPTTGQNYTLSIDANPQNANDNWFALGFAGSATNVEIHENSTLAWMLLRGNRGEGGVQTFLGVGTDEGSDHNAPLDTVNLKVVLDTSAAQWTAEWFINGSSIREETFSSNPTINYVGFGRFGDATGTVDNFTLTATAVPEPSTYALALGSVAVVVAGLYRRKQRAAGAPSAEAGNS